MTDWFRSWHGAPTDPKWLGIARKAGVAPGIAVAVAWALMDRASQADDRGSIAGYDADGLACFFGCDPEQVDAIVSAMEEKGVINDGRLTNWEKRQPKREDTSTQRVQAHRERNKPHAKRSETQCNAPDTDTDTERTDATASDASASVPAVVADDGWPADYRERFWETYPHRVGKSDALAKLDRIRKSKRVTFDKLMSGLSAYIRSKPPDRQWCNPATWLNQGRWDDEPSTDIQRNTAGQHELLGAFDRLAEHAQRMEDAGPPPGGWGA